MRIKMLRHHDIVVAYSEQRILLHILLQYDKQIVWMDIACNYVHQEVSWLHWTNPVRIRQGLS